MKKVYSIILTALVALAFAPAVSAQTDPDYSIAGFIKEKYGTDATIVFHNDDVKLDSEKHFGYSKGISSPFDDGSYWIKLESFATGSAEQEIKPADVVLVLDFSGSMNSNYKTGYHYEVVLNGTNNAGYAYSNGFWTATAATGQRFYKTDGQYYQVKRGAEPAGETYIDGTGVERDKEWHYLYYEIDGYVDYFYGTMLTNTSQLTLFALEPFRGGLLLRTPSRQDPSQLGKAVAQDKMFDVFQEHHRLQRLLGVSTVGDFNELVQRGAAVDVVNVSEALQEKKLALIAEQIVARKTVRMVLIAGPSSSGKTTTCKRLSVQLLSSGIKPIPISLDDYFLDRELSPVDERGEYDFESLYALNLPLLNEQMNSLFRGEEVELPRYDFTTGKSLRSGRRLRLHDNEVLVVEGIHALNPELTSRLPAEQLFKVYASALTTIMLDDHNYIPTTDNRLLRRIIRDCKYRGMSARETLRRWPSVREGENKWIFPYQENADVMFNSAMIYELAVIRTQAESVLDKVPENCDEYAEAYRLLKFLRYFEPLEPGALPPTSLLREFLGGSTFRY